jgi:hypothetical protein
MDTTDAARERVFKTEELFAGILSFLPFKTLFNIRRVSKCWAEGIDNSITLQQKMALRPRDHPELWILDRKHKIGANFYSAKYAHLNDTQLRFRRVKIPPDGSKPITPVKLNSMLRHNDSWMTNVLKMATGGGFKEEVVYIGRTDAFWDGGINASFWNTFLTDPPCHRVEVVHFVLYLDELTLSTQPVERPRIKAIIPLPEPRGLTIESNAGLRMLDILKACLTARGRARGWFLEPQPWVGDDATILDAVEAVEEKVGRESVSKKPRASLRMRLIGVGSAMPMIATDHERADANKGWE